MEGAKRKSRKRNAEHKGGVEGVVCCRERRYSSALAEETALRRVKEGASTSAFFYRGGKCTTLPAISIHGMRYGTDITVHIR